MENNDDSRQREIERRLVSYREEALIIARDSRPENTRKAYGSKQREWKDFCVKEGFQDGAMVTESKLLWFLEEHVFKREIRGSRYLKKRTTEGGERVRQTLSTGSVQMYVSAVIDLWSHQKAAGLNPHEHPRGQSVKAVLSARAKQERVRRRTEFLDRAAGSLQDGYDEAKMKEVVRYCWTGHQELKNPTPQSVESFLRTAVDFLLSHSMLLRGETRRGAEFAGS